MTIVAVRAASKEAPPLIAEGSPLLLLLLLLICALGLLTCLLRPKLRTGFSGSNLSPIEANQCHLLSGVNLTFKSLPVLSKGG